MNGLDKNNDELILAVVEGIIELQPPVEFRSSMQGQLQSRRLTRRAADGGESGAILVHSAHW